MQKKTQQLKCTQRLKAGKKQAKGETGFAFMQFFLKK